MKETPITSTDGAWSLLCGGGHHDACTLTNCLCPHHPVAAVAQAELVERLDDEACPGTSVEHGAAPSSVCGVAAAQLAASPSGETVREQPPSDPDRIPLRVVPPHSTS